MSRPGLRERKKIETLHRMQEEALRLFDEHGYEATTIEQIAEAAEVSPSTFYRYFPTKEDVVVQDEYDPMLAAVIERQPGDMPAIAAIRTTLAELFEEFTSEDMERVYRRVKMILEVPALLGRQFQQSMMTQNLLAEGMAARSGRSADDLEVRNFTAAVVAAWTTAVISWVERGGDEDLPAVLDRCLAHLEAGVPL